VNILTHKFYSKSGAEEIEEGFELQHDNSGKTLMTCKYCIKDELGMCSKTNDTYLDEPLCLITNNKKYKLSFKCNVCQMEIVLS